MKSVAQRTSRKPLLAALAALLCAGVIAGFAACAPKPQEPVIPTEWAVDVDCAVCHKDQQASLDTATMTASKHAAMNCTGCHSDEAKLAKAHGDGRMAGTEMPTRLKRTSIDPTYCTGCHDAKSLKEKTADLTILTDSKGNVVNPHDVPATPQHLDQLSCRSCHTMHAESDVQADAAARCVTCHHKNVYECGTCH